MKGDSLRRRMSATLAVAILSVGVVAAAASFALGFREARVLQDDALRYSAALAAPAPGADLESRMFTVRPTDAWPDWLPRDLPPGFHTVETRGERVRLYVLGAGAQRLVVGQDVEVRDDAAFASALRTLIPVVLLIPLLAWLTGRVLLTERRSLAQRRRFITMAAHELRSPLTALTLQAQNLRTAPDPETFRERVEALQEGIERARQVTEQLLAASRGAAATNEPRLIDLAAAVAQLVTEQEARAVSRGLRVSFDTLAAPAIRCDPMAVGAIVGNALDNAIKYTPAGGEIAVTVSLQDDDACVEIVDSGPGLDGEHLCGAFEPFSRYSQVVPGSGLGLAIAWEAATRAGGRVELEPRADRTGLVFRYRQRRARETSPTS